MNLMGKTLVSLVGDYNINLLQINEHEYFSDFFDKMLEITSTQR